MKIGLLVSNAEYCDFLNKVAARDDSHRLWNPLMQDHFWGGITRKPVNGVNVYLVKPGYELLPVTCVTWRATLRYCNWLSFGKPSGDEVLGVTEGDSEFGVYDTHYVDDEEFVKSLVPIERKTSQAYFLPTADEWRTWRFDSKYKTLPKNVYQGHWSRPFPHLAPVDEDVRGNVGEWVETRRGNFALALGGSLIRGEYSLDPKYQEGDEIDKAISSFGFRVASADMPELLPRPQCIGGVPLQSQVHRPESTWCRIGCKKNPEDRDYKVGRVDYEFDMARFALTNDEWCEFLNSVAAYSDPYGLYNPDMATGVCGGIEKRTDGFYVKDGWSRRPVVYIGYSDVMRYCNWLHFGKPKGQCELGVTEGTKRLGAYDTRRKGSYHRNRNAKYFIPTDNEWCKAAYYDPTKRGARKYWDYPCRTCDLPPNDPAMPRACNYLKDGTVLGEKGPFYLAEVDAYPTSDTYFGCRQMAGNVWEWVEPVGKGKMNLRGGSFGYTEFGMGIWNRDEAGIDDELYVFGVRIARAVENPRIARRSLWTLMGERFQDMSTKRILALVFVALSLSGVLGVLTGAMS